MKSKRTALQEKLHDDIRRMGGAHTKAGAGLLADHINAFWKGRVKAERYELEAGLGWGVRSNLVGGLPREVLVRGKTLAARRAEAMHGV